MHFSPSYSKLLSIKLYFLMFLGIISFYASAQNDTINARKPIDETHILDAAVSSTSLQLEELSIGVALNKINTQNLQLAQSKSIAQLLEQQTPVFVKSYGVNGLATLSFRGASAAQSAVFWNGIPMQNPMSGMTDISFLKAGLFDHVSLLYGGNGALWGSGNVGGALMLQSFVPNFRKSYGVDAAFHYGSFSRFEGWANGFFQNKKWFISAKTYYHTSKNNFAFRDYNQQVHDMSNAQAQSLGAMLDVGFRIDSLQQITFSVWYQENERYIPPALFETFSRKRMNDRMLKTAIKWQLERKKHFFWATASYGFDQFQYVDSLILLHNKTFSQQYFQEIGWKWQAHKNHSLYIFSPLQIAWATGNSFANEALQIRPALVANYRFSSPNQKWNFLVSARQEMWNQSLTPFLPSIGLDFYPIQSLKIYLSGQRSYRVPTLNELYYFPGGNINLKPEKAWNVNLGAHFIHKYGRTVKIQIEHQIDGFARWVNDWIYWMGGSIWTPNNIAQVFSGGAEVRHAIQISHKKWEWSLNAAGNYIVSITQKSSLPNDGSIGKQIPYTPRWNINLGASVAWNGLKLQYYHTITDLRYITLDESQSVPMYHIGNVMLHYPFNYKKLRISAGVELHNVWNSSYQIMYQRPMPGRYLMINFRIGFRNS